MPLVRIVLITTLPSTPALSAICLMGSIRALRTICAPVFSSPLSPLTVFSTLGIALIRATPPPGTIPSSTAALVAARASSIRSFFSFISTSVAAPTLITATPPASLARRSAYFSLSYSEVQTFICALMEATLSLISSLLPAPSTIMVFSLSDLTCLALPNIDMSASLNVIPISSLITVAPVSIAISLSISLRLSPNAGAFTQRHLNVPRILFTTKVARASLSKSSAMITSLLPVFTTCSKMGRIS
ncbi:secreted protein [Firmicutes bacterium CAG:552]|nr:secreted protein [Firmicutes bacterium CAG:552]